MEIFMRNISYTADDVKVTLRLQPEIHSVLFEPHATSPGLPINFKVFLFSDKRNRGHRHSGSGKLTLPSDAIGATFLSHFGGRFPLQKIAVDDRCIWFEKSNRPPRPDVLGEVQLLPYRDPRTIREKEKRMANFSTHVTLHDVQLAWLCRDETLSIEWQWGPRHGEVPARRHMDVETSDGGNKLEWLRKIDHWDLEKSFETSYHLRFNEETREVLVKRSMDGEICTISMRYSRIQSIETDSSSENTILLMLETPPSFETDSAIFAFLPSLELPAPKRRKLSHLNPEHAVVAPFTWNILRLVCGSQSDLAEFKRMADIADLRVRNRHYVTVRRGLFSPNVLQRMQAWLSVLDWSVAFQCEALHRDLLIDTVELLELRPSIEKLVATHGPQHAMQALRQFGLHLKNSWVADDEETVQSCFNRAIVEIQQSGSSPLAGSKNDAILQCLHVNFTPTTMTLRGPFPDTSNRILRRYPNHQDYFLRVSFADEDRLKFRFNHHEVDGPSFIDKRVGTILREGFTICGRRFEFLAYSQSALKEYTVWFVTPFTHRHVYVDAERIRASIGSQWPEEVRRCPARFAARLSQAFTATQPSILVEPDQVERMADIERNGYCFSDGNGPLSQEMADAIHDALQKGAGRSNRARRAPSVFQIRIQGAKGVLSIDPTLSGLKIGLRPSMVKFESLDTHEIEVARTFTKPGKLFLNRPLVMILEGLGVGVDVFRGLQQDAVKETQESSKTLKGAARLLETHGLGTAFAIPSTLLSLHRLGLEWKQDPSSSGLQDAFAERAMQCAVNHVMREMKYRARIPVPDSWKLVGVVDVHDILKPRQIYGTMRALPPVLPLQGVLIVQLLAACLIRSEGADPEYLKGRVLVSKSPTIHPGDVQIAEAIGAPPPDSPLKALSNCVVFSQRGQRPLPNELSGSDLDGDEYDLILLRSLHPPQTWNPGEYSPAPKKKLERDSTINDVADFVVDFINNDMLGVIATNFLLIADRAGIFDKACLDLAELHSWAVDFPKNGIPVPLNRIPQAMRLKPDWYAPEITPNGLQADYYESRSVLGKLFRDIRLPALFPASHNSRAQQQWRKKQWNLSLEDTLQKLSLDSGSFDDPISVKLRRRLYPLVNLEATEELRSATVNLFDYFAAELEHICFSHTLSRKVTTRLTEEEVFMGTIIAKSSQPRMRRDEISGMREETTTLVRHILKELEGGEDASVQDWVNRGYTAWKVSVMREGTFGSKSFGWIALRALFDGIKYLEEEV